MGEVEVVFFQGWQREDVISVGAGLGSRDFGLHTHVCKVHYEKELLG